MKQADLIAAIAEHLGDSKTDASRALEAVVAAITTVAKAGDDVSITGLGKFAVKSTPARKGRNPATGAEIDIPAGHKLAFTPAKAIRNVLAS